MPQYKMTISASSITSLQAKLKKLGVDEVQIQKVEIPTSRADRLGEAESQFEDVKSEVESLKDEMESWRDSLPDNLQQSDKASQIEDAISNLEDLLSNLEQCDFGNIEFPGMY